MALNEHGLPMTAASPAAAQRCDGAVDALLHFRPEMLDLALEAAREDPQCPTAAVLDAYLRLLSTEPADAAEARTRLAAFREIAGGRRFLPREEAHLTAAAAWASGDMLGAGRVLRALTREHPRDALALAVGHQIDFFSGDALSLRDRIAEAIGAWPEDHPHSAPLSGMLAFGLEEAGEYERAEEVGRSAVARDPRDVWGIHAVAHSLEMRARVREGLRYFEERQPDWGDGNVLAVHNWWRCALFTLEAGNLDEVRRTSDERIHHSRAAGPRRDAVDGSGLTGRGPAQR